MTERGTPIVNPARACPFVAFVDERDERSTVPDHRHRCYAEEVPAPRALAHQEAYCLSSSFPVCPTFQDWARREAAQARDIPGGATLAGGSTVAAAGAASFPESAVDRDDDDLAIGERRRDWAAPPAWRREDDDDVAGEPVIVPPVTTLGGSSAAAPAAAVPPAAMPSAGVPSSSIPSGLSGSLADRMAGGRDEEVAPASGRRDWEDASRAWGEANRAQIDEIDQWGDETGSIDRAALAGAVGGGAVAGRRDASWPREDREAADRLRSVTEREAPAPAWERPKRFEAYPALRARRGIPVVPLVIGLVVIALAAFLLFKLPEFLGVGAPTASPTPSPTEVTTTTPAPTTPASSEEPSAAPGPTATTYQVQPGDTMTKIANKFGVPLQDLIDANKDTVENPSNLIVGQTLIIPAVPPTTLPDAGTQAP
ncbi:MAG: LysM peptidoglycan-binding domain-containing protein [Chloroflexota bacterium]